MAVFEMRATILEIDFTSNLGDSKIPKFLHFDSKSFIINLFESNRGSEICFLALNNQNCNFRDFKFARADFLQNLGGNLGLQLPPFRTP